MNKEQASRQMKQMKSYAPFRAWFAIEIAGEWEIFDSMRKLKNRMRKAGIQNAEVLAAQ